MSLNQAIQILTEVASTTINNDMFVQELNGIDKLKRLERLNERIHLHKCVSCDRPMDSDKWIKFPICYKCVRGG